jgi:hypothetical protein
MIDGEMLYPYDTDSVVVTAKEKQLKMTDLLQARRAAAAEARKQDSEAAEDTSESSTNPDDEANMYEDLFTAVMMATDQDNRPLHTVFQLLPSKKVRKGGRRGCYCGHVVLDLIHTALCFTDRHTYENDALFL